MNQEAPETESQVTPDHPSEISNDYPIDNPAYSKQTLWGRDFTLTEQGLDPNEVIAFVDNLLARNKELSEQTTPIAMTNYMQKLMGELQNVEETVKAQAQRDAEAEAAKITTEAKRQAQEMVSSSVREASETSRKQADGIISEARKKAEIIEGQVQVQAQLLLSKAREQVEEHIRLESQIAYDQIMGSLTDVLHQAQKVESDWKYRSNHLWGGEALRLALNEISFSVLPLMQEPVSKNDANTDRDPPSPSDVDQNTPVPDQIKENTNNDELTGSVEGETTEAEHSDP